MKKLIFTLALTLSFTKYIHADEKAQGWCEDGNYTVTVPGGTGPSVNKYQRSFPSCTITVYNAGTLVLATIFADNVGTPKANPFTAANSGQWYFYAAQGRYDVKLSSGGIPVPFTLGDIFLNDSCTTNTTCTALNFNATSSGSWFGNTATQSTAVVLRIDNTFTNPDLFSQVESRGLSVVNRRIQTHYPEGSADQFAGAFAVTLEAGSSAGTINGQMKGVQSEIYIYANANIVTEAFNYLATIPILTVGSSITNWSGYIVNPPATCSGCITNGGGLLINNLLTSPATILNPYAIKIGGLAGAGQIQWPSTSITEVTAGTLNLIAPSVLVSGPLTANTLTTVNVGSPSTPPSGSGEWFSHVVAGVTTPAFIDSLGNVTNLGGGGGSGTVTSLSVGNLTGMFTSSVATPTTTPAVSYTLVNASPYAFWGNNSNSSGAPAYTITAAQLNVSSSANVVCSEFQNWLTLSNASSQTLTLPGTPCAVGWYIDIQNAGAGTWTISRNGNNIDGGTTNPTLTTASGIRIMSNGSAYFTQRGSGGSGGSGCATTDPSACWLLASAANAGNTGGANSWLTLKDNFTLNFGTNSTTALTVTGGSGASGQFIGIGTTSPSRRLEVNGGTAPNVARFTGPAASGGAAIELYDASTNTALIGFDTGLQLGTKCVSCPITFFTGSIINTAGTIDASQCWVIGASGSSCVSPTQMTLVGSASQYGMTVTAPSGHNAFTIWQSNSIANAAVFSDGTDFQLTTNGNATAKINLSVDSAVTSALTITPHNGNHISQTSLNGAPFASDPKATLTVNNTGTTTGVVITGTVNSDLQISFWDNTGVTNYGILAFGASSNGIINQRNNQDFYIATNNGLFLFSKTGFFGLSTITAPSCSAGQFFIYADSGSNVLKKCNNGVISNL